MVVFRGNLSRRDVVKQAAKLGVYFPLSHLIHWPALHALQDQLNPRAPAPAHKNFSDTDEALLEDLEKADFQFFWDQCNPEVGIVRDRCHTHTPDTNNLGSIASTGFGLTALCIGEKRGYVSHDQARTRVLNTLRTLWKKLPNHRGFFFHWADINTGERLRDSEVSSIDSAILLCGVLACREHFVHSEIKELASEVFNRVEWTWLSEDTTIVSHGWTPETGFLRSRWDDYSEMMMIYLLGLGSSSYPLPADVWKAWKRIPFEFDGIRYIGSFAPLFVHQYSQAWFDFRDKRDQYADYFQNSAIATDVHRRFCLDLAKQFPDYSDDLWGISSSDSMKGYVAWGGPPATGPIDGTVVPCASAGSLPFMPEAVMRVLRTIKDHYGPNAWTRYGFVDAFNPLKNWYDNDVIGINTGITMVMAENARTGFVWDTFMKNPEAQRGMERAGFTPYKPSQSQPNETSPSAGTRVEGGH